MYFLAKRRDIREKAALRMAARAMGLEYGRDIIANKGIKGEYRGREVRAWWRVSGTGSKDTLVIEVALAHQCWMGVWLGGRTTGISIALASLDYESPNLQGLKKVGLDSDRFDDLYTLRREVTTAQKRILQSEYVLSTLAEIRALSPKFQIVDDIIAIEIKSPAEESRDIIHSASSGSTALMLQQRIETLVDLAIRLDDIEGPHGSLKSTSGDEATTLVGADKSEVGVNEKSVEPYW